MINWIKLQTTAHIDIKIGKLEITSGFLLIKFWAKNRTVTNKLSTRNIYSNIPFHVEELKIKLVMHFKRSRAFGENEWLNKEEMNIRDGLR